jgi:hypothetical protein
MNKIIGTSYYLMGEHAYNNSITMAAGYSPIYANYSFNPQSNWPTTVEPRIFTLSLYPYWMIGIHKNCLTILQAIYKSLNKYYNKRNKAPLKYKDGNLVMLNSKNLNLCRPVKKFDITMIGPFKIDTVVSLMAMQLVLPES